MRGVYQKKSGIWYISYKRENGKRRREAVGPNREQAEIALMKKKIEVANNKLFGIDRVDKIKFKDFAKKYLKHHSSRNRGYYTESKNIKILGRYLDDKCLHEITIMDIEQFKTERAKDVAPATVNRSLSILKSMFNRAIEWGHLKENLVRKIKLFKENNERVRFLEKEEVPVLLANSGPHLKPILLLALNTGMRKGEILGLKWQDIDFKRGIAHLSQTKSGKSRNIPLNNTVLRTLTAIPKTHDSPFIFCNKDGKPYRDVKKSFLTAIKKSDIINFHFHDCRHHFASHLAMAGVDLNTIRVLLGHSTINMTLRYAHLSPDHTKRAVDILDGQNVTIASPQNLADSNDVLKTS